MNTSSPDPFAPEPLTPEERDMAMRLARIGPHGEPSPALDARIIGAAHAASGSLRSTRRWPALIGLAASLALAVGVTWQLQPGGETGIDGAMPPTGPTPAEESVARMMSERADTTRQLAVPAPPPAPAATREAAAERSAPGADVAAAPTSSAAPAPAAPPLSPSSEDAEPIMRAAEADARRAEREALSGAARDQAVRSRELTPRIAPPAAAGASPEAAPADMDDTAAMAKSAETAATPVAHDRELEPPDWIERIRQRRDSGDLAGARESLQSLRREHPRTPVPPDLLPLADEQP